jgi:F-type H+-transporting ATPase subunit epsilon
MAAAQALRLVVVTPERTQLDETVESLRFPLYDGEIGILPGRLPLIGRLGVGELVATLPGGQTTRLFIDGGFVQVNRGVVTLLTARALPPETISLESARQQLDVALAKKARSAVELSMKEAETQRARKMVAVARQN